MHLGIHYLCRSQRSPRGGERQVRSLLPEPVSTERLLCPGKGEGPQTGRSEVSGRRGVGPSHSARSPSRATGSRAWTRRVGHVTSVTTVSRRLVLCGPQECEVGCGSGGPGRSGGPTRGEGVIFWGEVVGSGALPPHDPPGVHTCGSVCVFRRTWDSSGVRRCG